MVTIEFLFLYNPFHPKSFYDSIILLFYLKSSRRRRENIELKFTYAISESSVKANVCLADQMC